MAENKKIEVKAVEVKAVDVKLIDSLLAVKTASEAMSLLAGKTASETAIIMKEVIKAKQEAIVKQEAIDKQEQEIKGLLEGVYGKVEKLPSKDVFAGKATRLFVYILKSGKANTPDEFVTEFKRIDSALGLGFVKEYATDKAIKARRSQCISGMAANLEYGKSYLPLFNL